MAAPEAVKENGTSSGGPNLRSVFWVGLLTASSRILGLVRESTKAYFLGTSLAADAFQIAFMVPSALRSLVAEGAVSSAIVPVFTKHARGDDRVEMRRVAEKYLSFWLGLVLAVTLGGVFLSGRVLLLLQDLGMIEGAEKVALTSELISVLFWYLLLIGLAAALQGILHAHGEFTMPALSPVLFNFVFIVTAWCVAPFLDEGKQVWAFAGAVLVGGAIQLALLAPFVWRLGVRPILRWPFDNPSVREMLRLLVPATFGAGIYQINVVVNLLLASRLAGDGFVSSLGYSSRLMEVVLGVFVFALNTVSLTALSRQAADKDWESYGSTLEEVLRLALFITIPSALGLYLLRDEIISLLFRSGSFDAASLRLTATAFQYHVLGLCFVGTSRGLVSGFYALRDVRTPVKVAALSLIFNLALAWSLSSSALGYAGIALASSVSAVLQMTLLGFFLRRKVPSARFVPVFRTAGKALVAAVVMGAVVWGGRMLLDVSGSKPALGAALGGVIVFGTVTYFVVARVLGMAESTRVIGVLRGRKHG